MFLGREISQERQLSEEMLCRAETAIQSLLCQAADRATAMLSARREQLQLLATTLTRDETLDETEISQLSNLVDVGVADTNTSLQQGNLAPAGATAPV